ncbi:MAG TPA: hypothetical protein VMI31_03150 [Fimbriimonadaceae bacterium]|nr:hypothetical protein [Fimbriimonadaceae bacterium]
MSRYHSLTKFAICAGVAALYGLSPAQTKTYNTVRTYHAAPVAITSTLDVVPQIIPDPPFNPGPSPENSGARKTGNPGPRNNLKAGGWLPDLRGRAGALFPGPVDGRYEPADNQMAVGPNNIVCIVNAMVAFYSKSGTKQFQALLDGTNGFFGSVAQSSFVFDPKAFYDSISNRYFLVADDGATTTVSNILVAVSATSDPNGTWYKYRFTSLYNGSWLDYPGFGFNKDAIIITGNLFDGSGGGVEALVVPKAPLLTGGNATVNVINDPNAFTIQPCRTVDKTVNYIYGAASVFPAGNQLQIYAFTNLTGTPLLKESDIAVPSYTTSGSGNSVGNILDADDDRIWVAQFRAGQIFASHTTGVNNNCAARWYDFNVNSWPASGAPSLKQSGTLAIAGDDLLYPAINSNGFGDISLFYTLCSGTIISNLCYSGRISSDPPGQMGQPVKLFSSTQGGYGGRWGDYNANEVDPNDDATFWGFSMAVSGGWYTTQVQTWTITTGQGTGTPVAPNTIVNPPFVGTYLFGDNTSVAATDGITYQVASAKVTQFGEAAGIEADFTVPTDTSNLSLDTVAAADESGGTAMAWAYNWTTSKWDLIASTPMRNTLGADQYFTIPSGKVSNYIGAAGLVRVEYRGHVPIKPLTGAMPSPFTLKIDLLQLLVR